MRWYPSSLGRNIGNATRDFASQPATHLLEATLVEVMSSFDDNYIKIGSLDVCSEGTEVVQWIQPIASRASGKLHVVVSSRPEPEIMQSRRALSRLEDVFISGHETESEICLHLKVRLSPPRPKWTSAAKT